MADNNAEVKDITKPVGTVDNTVDPNEIQLVEHVKEKHVVSRVSQLLLSFYLHMYGVC